MINAATTIAQQISFFIQLLLFYKNTHILTYIHIELKNIYEHLYDKLSKRAY